MVTESIQKSAKCFVIASVVLVLVLPRFAGAQNYSPFSYPNISNAIVQASGGPNPGYSVGSADIFINPALLAVHTRNELQLSNSLNLLSVSASSLSFSSQLSTAGRIGFGLLNLDQPGLQQYNSLENTFNSFDNKEFIAVIGYARRFNSLSLGLSAHYSRRELYERNFNSVFDELQLNFGLHYQAAPYLSLGFYVRNAFQFLALREYSAAAPRRYSVGISWNPAFDMLRNMNLLFTMEYAAGQPVRINSGVVLTLFQNLETLKKFNIRAGLGNYRLGKQKNMESFEIYLLNKPVLSIGAGVEIKMHKKLSLEIDYCFQLVEYVNNQHSFTTRLLF